jgi:hypothetical protein
MKRIADQTTLEKSVGELARSIGGRCYEVLIIAALMKEIRQIFHGIDRVRRERAENRSRGSAFATSDPKCWLDPAAISCASKRLVKIAFRIFR